MPPYADQVEELASAFLLINETDYAIETYLKGRKNVEPQRIGQLFYRLT